MAFSRISKSIQTAGAVSVAMVLMALLLCAFATAEDAVAAESGQDTWPTGEVTDCALGSAATGPVEVEVPVIPASGGKRLHTASSYNTDVDISVDKASYAVAIGQTLEVAVRVDTYEPYEAGVHKYYGWFAYLSHNQWNQVQSWYIDGGSLLSTMRMSIQNWESTGDFLFAACVFPIDNFTEGGSLADRTFHVSILPSSFEVRLDANGGTCPLDSVRATYACEYGDLPEPTRYGYTFDGWYTMLTGGSKVDGNTEVTAKADHTLYARWTENPKKDLSEARLFLSVPSAPYTGNAIAPEVTVIHGSRTLIPGVDYVAGYEDHVNAGNATVRVSGIGEYTGENTASFVITPAVLTSIALASSSGAYTGSAHAPLVSSVMAGWLSVPADGYDISYRRGGIETSDLESPGEVLVFATGRGNYTGTVSAAYTIAEPEETDLPNPSPEKVDLSGATVSLPSSSYRYTGSAHRPAPTVRLSGKTLVPEVDYRVAYEGNVNAGWARVVVTGTGDFTGSAACAFAITPASLNAAKVTLSTTSLVYTGKERKPSVTVKLGGRGLKGGADYSLAYPKGAKAVGTYKVTVSGKGNYTGSASATFVIVPKGTSVTSLKAAKASNGSGVMIVWKRQVVQTTGYEVRWSTSKSFTGGTTQAKRYRVSSSIGKKASMAKKLTSKYLGKRIYFQVRTYKTAGGKTLVSPWSKAKSVMTKR